LALRFTLGRLAVALAGRGRIGMRSRVPLITRLGSCNPLSWIRRSVLVLKRSAISERVSPSCTV
jgi:hypothetical protein